MNLIQYNKLRSLLKYLCKKLNIIQKDLLTVALGQYGVKEIEGKKDNPAIINYAKESGFEWINNDETPWCSVFMNWIAMVSGYERTHTATARDWLKVGKEIKKPEIGDVVVFQRGNSSWQGHVGLFIREEKSYIYLLGGNQSNKVNISKYLKRKVLGYRKLRKV